MKIVEMIGWLGTAAILAAYGLASFGGMSTTSTEYEALNGAGALAVLGISLAKQAWQPAALNFVWAVIAAVTLLRH